MNIPKYRVWHKQRKIMMPVLQIDLDPEHGGVFVESNDGHYCGCRLHMELWPWSDIELMQQTSLKDKHGTEVFESDLVKGIQTGYPYKREAEIQVAGYQNEYPYCLTPFGCLIGYDGELWIDELADGFEIIGNIWEHPDLIQDQSQH